MIHTPRQSANSSTELFASEINVGLARGQRDFIFPASIAEILHSAFVAAGWLVRVEPNALNNCTGTIDPNLSTLHISVPDPSA